MSRRKVTSIYRGDEVRERVAQLAGLLGMLERAAADREAGVETFIYSGPQCRCLPSIWPDHDPACETLAPPHTVEPA